jgi:hypothetical protein
MFLRASRAHTHTFFAQYCIHLRQRRAEQLFGKFAHVFAGDAR